MDIEILQAEVLTLQQTIRRQTNQLAEQKEEIMLLGERVTDLSRKLYDANMLKRIYRQRYDEMYVQSQHDWDDEQFFEIQEPLKVKERNK
jgi:hypothetical protein